MQVRQPEIICWKFEYGNTRLISWVVYCECTKGGHTPLLARRLPKVSRRWSLNSSAPRRYLDFVLTLRSQPWKVYGLSRYQDLYRTSLLRHWFFVKQKSFDVKKEWVATLRWPRNHYSLRISSHLPKEGERSLVVAGLHRTGAFHIASSQVHDATRLEHVYGVQWSKVDRVCFQGLLQRG